MDLRLGLLANRFQVFFARLRQCKRWATYKDRRYEQDSLDHSFSIALLTAFCVRKEKELSGKELNEALLIVHSLVHDFCEGVCGDVTFRFKNDPRIKYLFGLIEKEEGLRQMDQFDLMGPFLKQVYVLPEGSLEEKFFDAMEKLDYFLYALSEYFAWSNLDFVAVFYRQHAKLVEYAKCFASVALFYTPEVQQYVEEQINLHPERLKNQAVLEVTEQHIYDIEEALRILKERINSSR